MMLLCTGCGRKLNRVGRCDICWEIDRLSNEYMIAELAGDYAKAERIVREIRELEERK